jgi:AcrR family transcriptional regulator
MEVPEKVEGALIRLVGRQGYEATSEEQICGCAEVTAAQFAGAFGNKQVCLERVWEALVDDYIANCNGAYEAAGNWRDGLRAAGYAALDWLFEDEARTRFFLVEVMAGGEMVRAHRDRMMDVFIDMLDGGRVASGQPERFTRNSAEGLTGAVYNNAIESIKGREGVAEARQRVKRVMHLIVLTYLGPFAAAEELQIAAPGEGTGS